MAKERIIELGEASGLSNNDYVMIDNMTKGARKILISKITGKQYGTPSVEATGILVYQSIYMNRAFDASDISGSVSYDS